MAARKSIALLAVLVLGLLSSSAFAQTAPNDWAWMGGSSTIPSCSIAGTCGATGVYGTMTQFAAGNIPGARQQSASWTDSKGNLWLFGGNGYDSTGTLGYLNDLWEYNPTTKQWAWMGGANAVPSCTPNPGSCGVSGQYGTLNTPSAGNIPGARVSAATWTDGNGNFWLFGGSGYDSAGNLGWLNDLWEFSPATLKWTWMSGSNLSPNIYGRDGQPGIYGTLGTPSPANVPGARSGASSWVDTKGNLWLFGGAGEDAFAEFNLVFNDLNDLWMFNPSTGEWTWEGGSDEIYVSGNPGVYGTQGVAAPTNQPGAREFATNWRDNNGNFWLLGGTGYNATNYLSTLDDLWEFSPATGEWTWVSGNLGYTSPAQTNPGVYGTLGAFAPGNMPEGRANATGWSDPGGNLWLFGGTIVGAGYEDEGYLDDVWEYSPSKNEWAWMGVNIAACTLCTQPGVYGTLSTPDPANVPGGRIQNASWTDANGHLWIFGGNGFDSAGSYGYLNDLWEYQPVSGTPPVTATPTVTVAPASSSITQAQALAVTVTVSGGGGNPTPTGSITLTSGTYTSQTTALSGGSAVINIAANLLTPTVDTLTAYYTPDAASASVYNGANGSAIENVAATSQTNADVSVSTDAYSVWTTQALPVTVEVGGNYYQVPTGTVVLTAGSYTSPSVAIIGGQQTSGWAHFEVPAGSMPVGPGTITATYTPDAISSESLTGASGTASVFVSVQPASELDWTWMGGDSILPGINSQYGVYGTLGVAAPTNWPGGRTGLSFWNADSNGNFWIFGGEGNDSIHHGADMNDLWEFNPTTGEWTWVSGNNTGISNNGGGYNAPASYGTLGVFAAGNVPGGRSVGSTGIDSSNNLWLFGGYGFDSNNRSAYLNDLWEFNPSKDEWAWISGSDTVGGQQNGQVGSYGTLGTPAASNVPPARQNAMSWFDNSGNFWIFGGYTQDVTVFNGSVCGDLNDLWMFNPSTSQWTWMGGNNLLLQPNNCTDEASPPPGGTYGTLKTFAAGNYPGSREEAAIWKDSSGNIWMFGGDGYDANDNSGYLNDIWEFNPSINQWAWMGGSQTHGQNGVYGTVGVAASGNTPGSRFSPQTWIDSSGDFWLLGGVGRDAVGNQDLLNDLWELNPATLQWTWMGGSSNLPLAFGYAWPGIYGTLGVPASANTSGGRDGGAGWVDKNGSFWLFGGYGWDAVQQDGWMNDLWKYRPAENANTPDFTITTAAPSMEVAQAGDSATYSVTVAAVNDFSGQIAINPTTIPQGMGVQYPASVTLPPGGSQNISIVILSDPSLGVGTFSITLTGMTSGGLTHSLVLQIVVQNPGITPTVTVTPSPASITTAQAASVTVAVNGGSGNPTPTGSVTLTSGTYSSGAVTLSGGSATIDIPAGSLAKGTDTLTASYSPDQAGSLVYTNATGSSIENVTAVATAPTVTVVPSPASITTAQTVSVTVTVSGTPTPTGSVTLTSGTYSSGAVTLSSGTATISIPAGTLAMGTDTLTANYTPDSASSSTYTSATGSNVVAVTAMSNQPGWTWMGGANTSDCGTDQCTGLPGVYGTLGTPAAGNIPGSRGVAASWTDNSGNLWLFGGDGDDAGDAQGYLNDVWEFNTSSNEWAWMGGSNTNGPNLGQPGVYGTLGTPAAGNIPGGRFGSAAWTDKNGQFWLFGGLGIPPGVTPGNDGYPDDLWKFNPSTNQWAWMGGSDSVVVLAFGIEYGRPGVYGTLGTPAAGNTPGGREEASTWTDSSGNLWLFGGSGFDGTSNFGYLNDLWEFNPSTNQWAWISGSNSLADVLGQPGVYGTLGTPAATNTPGGRDKAVSWTDNAGNLWLFGGEGFVANGRFGVLNDLWEFNVSTKQWAWMGGDSTVGPDCNTTNNNYCGWPGVYGTLGFAATGNIPGSRDSATSWTDSSGNFWLYGGLGFDDDGNEGYLNDLWEFNPSLGQWAWINGSSTTPSSCLTDPSCGEPGVFGTLGTPVGGNTPGGRISAPGWTDKSGNFWLFGGTGIVDCTGDTGLLNNLWRYFPSLTNALTTPTVTVSPSSSSITTAQSLGVTITVAGPCGSPTSTGSVTLSSGSYTSAATTLSNGSATITVPAAALATGNDTLTASYSPDSASSSTYTNATGTNTETVTAAAATTPTVTVTPSPAGITTAQGLSVTVTVGGTPTPTGSVVLTSGSYTSAAVTLSGGAATISIPAGSLAKGTDTLTATYTPDAASSSTYTSATGSNTVTVSSPALITPTVIVTPGSSSITTAQPLSVTVAVGGGSGNPTPTGSVTLTSGTYNSGAVTLSGGSATINIPAGSLTTGADTLTASYTPDSNSSSTYNSATGSNTVTVTAATVQVTIGTSPAGLSFSVDGTSYTSTQTLTWTVGASHTITTTTPQILAGTQESFSAWSDGGAESHTVTASSTTTTYTASFTATAYQLTTAASPAADGSVIPASGTFYAPGTVVNLTATANSGFSFTNWTGSVASANSASTTITMSAPESVTANFGAAANSTPVAGLSSVSPLVFTAVVGTTSAAQSATLTNSGNATLTIAGITITGTNPADFAISTGTNACGTTLAAGANCLIYVTFTPASAATFSATLSVADNAAGSPQTAGLTGTGTPIPTFTLTSPTPPQTIQPGGTAQFTIIATSQNGTFSNAVSLSASGLPTGAIGTFTPASVTPGNSSANSTLSIQTGTTATAAITRHNSTWPFATSALALIGLCFVPGKRRRRWITMALLLIASLGALTGLTACGGGFAIVAPPQSYTITVTGTSGTEVQTTTVQLTVQ